MFRTTRTLALIAIFASSSVGTAAQPSSAPRADNYYAAGQTVAIITPMPADVIVAGRHVRIESRVAGDILAAAWRAELTAPADDDVRIAASEVSVTAPVAGDVTVAGGEVTFGPAARVGGRGWITGGHIRLDGTFDRALQVAGGTVQIGGEIREPIRVVAEQLELLPGARLLAGLDYRSPREATIDAGATITGPVSFVRIEESEAREAHQLSAGSTLLFVVHLLAVGVALLLAFGPRFESSVVERLRAHPWASLGRGLLVVLAAPIAALLLMITILGLPLGIVLACGYVVALLVGIVMTAFAVGDFERTLLNITGPNDRRQQFMFLLAGIVTLALARLAFGAAATVVALLFGVGALATWLRDTVRLRQAATA